MSLPDWREWLYSAKAFAAAMIALFIALAMDLPNPYWSVATVYIVSHPLSGATSSKALYRALGTIIGAAAAVALVPPLVDTPIILSLATAAWVFVALYLALLDRTPSSYIFMLSAYTMPLIALPTLMHPEQVYDVALARTEEILLGIVSAAVVNTVVFPKRIGPVLGAQMDQLLAAASSWTAQLLTISSPKDRLKHMRHRLLADMVALDALIKQLSYDSASRLQALHAQQMRLRMTMLVPQASALSDPLQMLHLRQAATAPQLDALVHRLIDWMAAGSEADSAQADRLRQAIDTAQATLASDDIDRMLSANALLRLTELVDLWDDCLSLRRAFRQSDRDNVPVLRYRARQQIQQLSHFDHGMLLFGAGSAALATLAASLLWIFSGWEPGANGVVLAAVGCCFFAAIDDPRPQLGAFLHWGVVMGTSFALLYLFAILPRVDTFFDLALVLAPALLWAGAFTGRPQHTMTVMLFTSQALTDLGLRDYYSANFESFANGSLSAVLGMIFALLWTNLTKPFGTELIARRLARSMWQDLAMLGRPGRPVDQIQAASRLVDRTGQLLPRVVAIKDQSLARTDAVRDLRIGLRLLDLQTHRGGLAGAEEMMLTRVLRDVSDHFQQCYDAGHPLEPAARLRRDLDAAVRQLIGLPDDASRHAAQALIGLRLALFPLPATSADPTAEGVFAAPSHPQPS